MFTAQTVIMESYYAFILPAVIDVDDKNSIEITNHHLTKLYDINGDKVLDIEYEFHGEGESQYGEVIRYWDWEGNWWDKEKCSYLFPFKDHMFKRLIVKYLKYNENTFDININGLLNRDIPRNKSFFSMVVFKDNEIKLMYNNHTHWSDNTGSASICISDKHWNK